MEMHQLFSLEIAKFVFKQKNLSTKIGITRNAEKLVTTSTKKTVGQRWNELSMNCLHNNINSSLKSIQYTLLNRIFDLILENVKNV